jgi:adenine-specific DNA-methyltransferase
VRKNEDAPKVKLYLERKRLLEEAKLTQSQISDVFNHIYEFFSRYYDKGDFLSKRRFGNKDKYYVPYNGEEVVLYWATRDEYYIKTSEYLRGYSFKAGQYKINFIIDKSEQHLSSSKSEPNYFILSDKESVITDKERKELNIHFNWRKLNDEEKKRFGPKNTQESINSVIVSQIIAQVTDQAVVASLMRPINGEGKSLLEKHLVAYVKKNTSDYFIHKDLSSFLKRELDFYIKNEVLDLNDLNLDKNANISKAKISAIKTLSNKIIDFLSQIEDFQKILFEKKKFVLKADYCLTLDLIPENFYDEIARNEKQLAEWQQLFGLEKITQESLFKSSDGKKVSPEFLKVSKHLVLDTAHFEEDFKDRLLSCFDDLDGLLGGTIINSENWQALNLLENSLKGAFKCIYIDPPYNTGTDGFNYKDNYQHSSWLSMMYDRIRKSSTLLSEKGTINISIDENEIHPLKIVLDNIFSSENFLQKIIWKKRGGPPNDQIIGDVHEYVIVYAKNYKTVEIYPKERGKKQLGRYSNPDNHPKGPWAVDNLMANVKGGRYVDSLYFPIVNPNTGEAHYPSSHGNWRFNKERIAELIANNEIYFGKDGKGRPKLKRFLCDVKDGVPYPSIWDHLPYNNAATKEIENYFGDVNVFDTPKPVELIKEIIKFNMSNNGLILDFFAGSGSVADAVLRLNLDDNGKRRYLLVEMDTNTFEKIIKPRIKRLMFSQEWRQGTPISKEGITHAFKYLRLEQFDDTLNNIIIKETDKTAQETLDRFEDYFLRYMLDYETRESPTRLMVDRFVKPFDYKIRTINSTEEKTVTVDLVETFNYLLGLIVEKFQRFIDNDRIYRVVFGKLENQSVCVIWRDLEQLDLEKDKQFIETKILADKSFDFIYVNGDSYVKNARPIEPEFKRLMGA